MGLIFKTAPSLFIVALDIRHVFDGRKITLIFRRSKHRWSLFRLVFIRLILDGFLLIATASHSQKFDGLSRLLYNRRKSNYVIRLIQRHSIRRMWDSSSSRTFLIVNLFYSIVKWCCQLLFRYFSGEVVTKKIEDSLILIKQLDFDFGYTPGS